MSELCGPGAFFGLRFVTSAVKLLCGVDVQKHVSRSCALGLPLYKRRIHVPDVETFLSEAENALASEGMLSVFVSPVAVVSS
jgi:hypothetical protein